MPFQRPLNISDFLTVEELHYLKNFIPKSRDEYIEHLQHIYNLKLQTPFPLVVHIEPTNFCNYRCIMCSHSTMKRKAQEIDESVMEKAINECASAPLWSLQFFFFGEPFLNKKTIEYMRMAKEKGIKNVSITTNFSVVDQETIDKIVKYKIDSIHISFHGLNRERFYKIHQVDMYDTVLRNINRLIEARKRSGGKKPWISITYVQTTESDQEMEQFRQTWLHRIDNVHISPQLENLNGSIDGKPRTRIALEQKTANTGGILVREQKKRVPCRQLWTKMAVLSNGALVPCSQNIDGELAVGNIRDMTIAEAWTGWELAKLRMQHIANIFEPGHACAPCTDWDWSGRVDNRPKANTT